MEQFVTQAWYVVRVQSGKEDQIRDRIQRKVQASEGLPELITEVIVPIENVTEMKSGKKRVRQRKLYPGYIMVKMELTDDSWHLIKSTNGVGDFVGPNTRPQPMNQTEADRILVEMAKTTEEAPKLKIDFNVGDSVKIKEGPFENFDGTVEEVNPQKGMVRVMVSIFGRATPVELEYWQIEAI